MGQVLRTVDVRVLEAHHSAPVYRRSMGGKKAWGNYGQATSEYAASSRRQRSWELWGGAWSVSPKQRDSQITRYDQVEAPQEDRGQAPWRRPAEEPRQPRSVMSEVQKSLTATRKADGKIRKLQEERRSKERAWDAYVEKTKREFTKNRRFFEGDLERIDKELAQTAEAGENAAVRVQELILQGQAAIREAPAEVSEDADWSAVIAGAEEEDSGFYQAAQAAIRATQVALVTQQDRVLQSGLAAALSTPQRGTSVAARSPMPSDVLQRAAGALPAEDARVATPQFMDVDTVGPATSDSYPTPNASPLTPSMAKAMSHMSMSEGPSQKGQHPGQRDVSLGRARPSEAPPRKGIKDATKQPGAVDTGGVSLSDKLQAKRAVMQGGAMHPFGKPPPHPPPVPPQELSAEVPEGRNLLAKATIEEDDEDLEDELGNAQQAGTV